MRNKDDTVSGITDFVHYFKKLFTSFLSKRCCRLINNQNLWIEISGFYDLYQFSILKIIVIDNFCRIDIIEAITIQVFLCLFVHGCSIFNTMFCKFIFVPKKNVFCYGQSGKCSYLLYDDRNSLMVCLYLIGCCDFFSFQNKFSGIFLIDTSQTGSQCRFTGTIFTDYDCNYRMTIFLKCQSEEKSCQRKCNDFVFGNIYTHIFCNHFITSDCICIDSDLCIFQDKCTEEICDQCQDQIDRIITECSIFCRKDYILSVCGIYAQGFVDQRKCTGYDQR